MKSIYHLIPFLAVLLSIPVSLPAQKRHTDANIYGHVIDASTREHLGFASVVVKDMGIGAETDSTGHYLIANLSEGRHTIEVSFIGYRSVTLTITAESGRSEEHNFELVPESDYLEQVVVTGSRYATKRRESGQIVNVVSPKLFEKTVAVNPAGVLDFQPGLRVEYDCSNCGFSQLRINGLSGQYTQVLLDSRPVFSSLSMVYGLEQFPASMIERIEVVRGGGSALFGSSAIGGTVNIITREPTSSSLDFSNHCGMIGGDSFENNTALNASLLSDDRSTGAYLFTMVRSREGYDHDGDGFTNLPKLLSETIGMRAYHKFSSRAKITAEYHHIHEYRRGGDSLQWQPHLCMIAEQLEHRIDGGGLSFDYSSERDAFSLYASAQNIGRNSYYGTGRNPDAYGITSDITFNAGLQYIRRISRFLFMPSTFTAGADYTANLLNDRIPGYNRFLNQHTRVGGVYIQNEWSGSHFGWLAGLRADKHNLLSESVFSPRMILRYAPDSHWTLRAGYAGGFRAPQAYDEDLHVAAVGGEVSLIRLDENLKPEHSDAFTVSADYWMQAGGWKFNMLLEGFHTGLRDVFILEPDGHDEQGNLLLKRTNSAGASVTGTNLEIRALNGRDLEIQSGVTLQRSRYAEPYRWSENVEPQERMHRSPDWYGYLTLDWEMTHSLEASLNGTLTGPMLVEHYAGAIAEDTLVTTDPFADLSARISWHFHPTAYLRCALSLSCKNLLNSFQKDMDFGPLKDSGYVYGPAQPRSWMLGVKLTF